MGLACFVPSICDPRHWWGWWLRWLSWLFGRWAIATVQILICSLWFVKGWTVIFTGSDNTHDPMKEACTKLTLHPLQLVTLSLICTIRLIGHKDAVTCVSLKEGTLVSGSRWGAYLCHRILVYSENFLSFFFSCFPSHWTQPSLPMITSTYHIQGLHSPCVAAVSWKPMSFEGA